MRQCELHMLYKSETGQAVNTLYREYTVYRSKGQWYIDATDEEMMNEVMFPPADPEYVQWLENKVMELLK